MSIEAGKLRHRIRIDRPTPVLDSNGDEVQADNGEVLREWVEIDRVWGAVKPASVREFIQSSTTQSQIIARVEMRYRTDLEPTDRLVHVRTGYPDVIYAIAGILPDADSGLEYINCPVSAGVNDGT
jgi:SPP1 family predicted phage head-tail adaptor